MRPDGIDTLPIEGKKIYLRQVRPSDVDEGYFAWLHDEEVTKYLEVRLRPPTREGLLSYVRSMRESGDTIFLAIVDRDTNRHVGNIKLGPINLFHRTADIGLLIGEKGFWGRGIATEAVRLVAGYAWQTLDLQKLTASCYGTNQGSVRAFQKAGFSREGVRRAQFLSEGRRVDQILMGLTRTET